MKGKNQQAITPGQVRHIAGLARIELRPGDQENFARELGEIIGYVNKLGELDTDGIDPSFLEPVAAGNLREDIPGKTLEPVEALKNAPLQEKGYFRVPRILGPSESA